MVICFLRQIELELEACSEKIKTDAGKNVYGRIKQELRNRFDVKNVHVAASLLDPALKNVEWMKDYLEKDENGVPIKTESEVLRDLIILFDIEIECGTRSRNDPEVEKNDPVSENVDSRRLKLLSDIGVTNEIEVKNMQNSIIEEIQAYFLEPLANIPSSTIKWWKSFEAKFPRLAKLFEVFLSMPAASSSSEVAFSKSGKFLRPDRSMLTPSKVNKMCFVNSNIGFLEKGGHVFVPDFDINWRDH